MAVVVRQVSTQLAKVKHPINSPEEVILGDVIFEMKGMEQLVLHHLLMPHHFSPSHSNQWVDYISGPPDWLFLGEFFNRIDWKRSFANTCNLP